MKEEKTLNSLVAETFFGFSDIKWDYTYQHLRGLTEEGVRDFVPKFTTDLTAAWCLIEHLKDKGLRVSLNITLKNTYCCMFFKEVKGESELIGLAESEKSASAAICIAALRTEALAGE